MASTFDSFYRLDIRLRCDNLQGRGSGIQESLIPSSILYQRQTITEAAKSLLVAFELLPVEDRREVAAESFRLSTVEECYESTEDLIQATDRGFLEFEGIETSR